MAGEVVVAVEGAHMMMQCPRCSTRWRVAAAAPVENPLFKCGRCHHLFRQFPGAPSAREAASDGPRRGMAAPPAEPDTLEFIFPEKQPNELLLSDDVVAAAPIPRAAAMPAAALRDTTEVVAATVVASTAPRPVVLPPGATLPFGDRTALAEHDPAESDDDSGPSELGNELMADPVGGDDAALEGEEVAVDAGALAVDDDELALEDELTVDNDELALDAEELALEDDEELERDEVAEPTPAMGRRVRVEDTMRAPAGFGTIMRAIGTAVTAFAALALMVRVAPERSSAWLSYLPVAGASFAHDRNLTTKVELTNVHGKFQRLRNERRVFVISGDARNNSPITIERIEVAGALYGLGGGELDQKVVTTGNRTTLTDLSEAEIVLLQRLDPAIALAPGETTPFLIVFLEPPRELREFSSRVLSVRPTRRASRPSGSSQGSVG